jgi:hypothetical protein
MLAQTADAERRLVHQMHGHARHRAFGPRIAPSAEQIPGSQAQMLRRQEPNSDLVSRNFVGQQLANFSLEAGRIARLKALLTLGALCLDLLGYRSRATGVGVFFCKPKSLMTRSTLRMLMRW